MNVTVGIDDTESGGHRDSQFKTGKLVDASRTQQDISGKNELSGANLLGGGLDQNDEQNYDMTGDNNFDT